jgi:hypothetical protein
MACWSPTFTIERLASFVDGGGAEPDTAL